MLFYFKCRDEARLKEYYQLGNHSYSNESAYKIGEDDIDTESWKYRLWGSNYDSLLEIKRKFDPQGVFWCRHCVGDEENFGTI